MQRALVVAALALAACSGPDRVIVAAGTTVVDSGLIDLVADAYEGTHPGVELSVLGEATAQLLELGRRGAADVLITHAPEAELQFLATEDTTRYEQVFRSTFVLVGPPAQAASLAGLSVVEAMQTIAENGWLFVTRADGSGTHAAEIAIWEAADIDPRAADWYIETGQGMGLTLQVADERPAFTLAELGTFRDAESLLGLVVADVGSSSLLVNPYHVTVPAIAPAGHEAERFADWLVSEEGRAAVTQANEALFGEELVYRLP